MRDLALVISRISIANSEFRRDHGVSSTPRGLPLRVTKCSSTSRSLQSLWSFLRIAGLHVGSLINNKQDIALGLTARRNGDTSEESASDPA